MPACLESGGFLTQGLGRRNPMTADTLSQPSICVAPRESQSRFALMQKGKLASFGNFQFCARTPPLIFHLFHPTIASTARVKHRTNLAYKAYVIKVILITDQSVSY
jgi:hypothetical protein